MKKFRTGRLSWPAGMAIVALTASCASGPERPHQALARAEASIEQAEQSGAREYGAVELSAAREKLNKARAAANEGEHIVARRYAEQAALDAELAAAMTRSRKAELSVEQLNRSIETLREEIARSQARSGVSR